MKKVFLGAVLISGEIIYVLLMVVLSLLAGTGTLSAITFTVMTLALQLITALGYYLMCVGAGSLPQTNNWEWVGKIAKIMCGITVAVGVVQALQLSLPSVVNTILTFVTSWGNFLVIYLTVLGVRDLQYSARTDLGADKLYKIFLAYVILGLVSSLINLPLIGLVELAAYVVVLVLLGKAAKKYEDRYQDRMF